MSEPENADEAEGHRRLADAERAENWALVVLVGWSALLLYILAMLLFSDPWWGAAIGLGLWALGAKGVLRSYREAASATAALRVAIEDEDESGAGGREESG